MQLSQLLNMTVPTSPIQGKPVADESEKNGGDNGLFDSLLEMYISPDKLKNSGEGLSEKLFSKNEKILDEKTNDLIKTISKLDSEDFINEIKDSLNLADEKTIFFFDNKMEMHLEN